MKQPQEWKIEKLGDILKLEYGKSLPKSKRDEEGKYPAYGANGIKCRTNEFYCDRQSIIVGRKGTAGAISLTPDKFWPLDVTYFVSFDNEAYDLKFIYFLLQSLNLPSLAKGVKPGINRNDVYSIERAFPPLPEQQRIVSILDEVFEGIGKAVANVERNLENNRELFESYLNAVFTQKGEGWVEKPLVEVTSKLGDGLHGTPKYTENGEYYFINGNNLNNGLIKYKVRTKRVSREEYNKHKKELNSRTVLVSINGTLGNVAFYNNEKIILGKSACYFNLHEGVDKNYIKHIICSPYFIKYAHREATGATIKNVSLKSMRNFMVPLPPENEQKTISLKLDAILEKNQNLEAIYKQKLDNLAELKQSILQKAFTGELTSKTVDKIMEPA